MNDNGKDLVIGVDGGGSSTECWLAELAADALSEPLGRGIAGPSNVRVVGQSAALQNLADAVERAFQSAGATQQTVRCACLALAGSDRASDQTVVEQWAQDFSLAERVAVVHDALPILYAGCPDGQGVALIAGTGSLAFGRNAAGVSYRCGGWGPLFGDEGSAYAIALAGLRAAARCADGRGPHTQLEEDFLKRLGVEQPSELIEAIYRTEMDRPAIANCAATVFSALSGGDEVAREIIAAAAAELAEMASVLVERLGLPTVHLAFGGGLFTAHDQYASAVVQSLDDSIPIASATTVSDPARGAVQIARSFAE
ncbi:MAG: BadF/BadG/BcrA/BcrD ATPase family protein [Pirellulaceae bacterium]|jgi:N-acetylglucosamine kinase-like BadF-type ATPase|nr:BadF/BadG/BcrA/BcrD ATPase family protein [Pirellulaceae bacterium]MDP7019901.1 BadF/BadG/BcrA/BcrD ATPase family protein [Pirellulaceae bacterium]